jgi:hypothetical protein
VEQKKQVGVISFTREEAFLVSKKENSLKLKISEKVKFMKKVKFLLCLIARRLMADKGIT